MTIKNQDYEVDEDGKLVKTESEDVDFEKDLSFDG